MNESKIDLTDRLRQEGRWAEASLRKDVLIAELRASGLKRVEAAAEAWRRLAAEFPPLEPDEDDNDAMEDDACPPLAIAEGDSLPLDWEADVLWVYHALGDESVPPAPSRGAANLLRWAKKNGRNRGAFYSTMLPRLFRHVAPRQQDEAKEASRMDPEEVHAKLEQYRLPPSERDE
jgi:hypothetical protein